MTLKTVTAVIFTVGVISTLLFGVMLFQQTLDAEAALVPGLDFVGRVVRILFIRQLIVGPNA